MTPFVTNFGLGIIDGWVWKGGHALDVAARMKADSYGSGVDGKVEGSDGKYVSWQQGRAAPLSMSLTALVSTGSYTSGYPLLNCGTGGIVVVQISAPVADGRHVGHGWFECAVAVSGEVHASMA